VFDISFSELVVVAVVALLVIGPEKLPKLARTLGAYTGRMQRFVAQVKDEVNREVRFEELQKLQQEVKSASLQAESSIMAGVNALQNAADNVVATPEVKAIRPRKKVLADEVDEDSIAKATSTSLTSKSAVKAKRKVAAVKKSTDAGATPVKPLRASKKIAD
jgi:sec-independent protein translocase protein TatB